MVKFKPKLVKNVLEDVWSVSTSTSAYHVEWDFSSTLLKTVLIPVSSKSPKSTGFMPASALFFARFVALIV